MKNSAKIAMLEISTIPRALDSAIITFRREKNLM